MSGSLFSNRLRALKLVGGLALLAALTAHAAIVGGRREWTPDRCVADPTGCAGARVSMYGARVYEDGAGGFFAVSDTGARLDLLGPRVAGIGRDSVSLDGIFLPPRALVIAAWRRSSRYPYVLKQVASGAAVLLSLAVCLRRYRVSPSADGWCIRERWPRA